MKILFLGEPSSPNTISWVEGLREQGCEVVIASARTDGADGNIPIGNPQFPPRLRVLSGVKGLKQAIKEIKPDILIAYRITSYGYIAAKTGFHPLVLAAQNEQIVYLPKPSWLRRKLLTHFAKFAIKNADLIHSWGENITRGLLKFGADEKKILTLHRGIDMAPFGGDDRGQRTEVGGQNSPISNHRDFTGFCRPDGQRSQKAPTLTKPSAIESKTKQITKLPNHQITKFISTRALAPEYLIDKLIDAFSLVVKEIPGAKLEIAGSGPEEAALKSQVEKLNLGKNVVFHGRLNRKELIDLLYSSNIYISIIPTEGISSSLIEGIAAGLLPIVADMPASRAMIQDKLNGYLIKDIKPDTLAGIMIQAGEELDKMKLALLDNRQKIMESYNRETNQRIFVEKYQELIR